MPEELCTHINEVTKLKLPAEFICGECVRKGEQWVHLRTCQTCGITLCCDDSPNKHMTKHYHKTDHPVIISAEQGERWLWCYKDELLAEY